MAGKKKNMEGGGFGLVPIYTHKNINDIAYKIIHGKKEENKMVGFKWVNSNYLRAEQRITKFFEKLKVELTNSSLEKVRADKLFEYFKKIIEKYPDKIEMIVDDERLFPNYNNKRKKIYNGDFFTAYFYFLRHKYETNFKALDDIFKKLKITFKYPINKSPALVTNRESPNSNLVRILDLQNEKLRMNKSPALVTNRESPNSKPVRIIDPQNEKLRMNNKKQKLIKDNNILYENLIEEFDEWIERDLFQNFRDKRTITVPVEEKNDLFLYIIDLANRIHGLGKHYSLSEYKDITKLNILKEKLGILKELYKLVFISSNIPINKAKNYENTNRNLNKKYQNLNGK
jgi:hypothetical protein